MPQSTHHGKKLVRIIQSLAELPSTEVGLSNFRSGKAFGGKQRGSQRDVQIHVALETLRGIGERLEQCQPRTQVCNRFYVC
jgi:hypothetical protein